MPVILESGGRNLMNDEVMWDVTRLQVSRYILVL